MTNELKSQPNGVVLPERKTWNQVTGREGFIETEAHNACLDEVARLNTSTVGSAPSHGEQVRDVSAMARVLSDRQADSCNVDRDDQWKIYGQDFIDDVTAMIAAAPSAGSQEQGE